MEATNKSTATTDEKNEPTGTTYVMPPTNIKIYPKCYDCKGKNFKSLSALDQHFAIYHPKLNNPPRDNASFWTKRVDVKDGDTIVCRKSSTRWECGGCKNILLTGKGFFVHVNETCSFRVPEEDRLKQKKELRDY